MKPEDGKRQHTEEGPEAISGLSSATDNRLGPEPAYGADPLVCAICQALDREEKNQDPSVARKLAMARREALARRSPATAEMKWNGLSGQSWRWRLVPACAAAGLAAVLLWGQPVGLLTGKAPTNRFEPAATGANAAAQARKPQPLTPGAQQVHTTQPTAAGTLTALEGADIDMLAAEEQMDLVGQLDFYQWLAGGGEDAV